MRAMSDVPTNRHGILEFCRRKAAEIAENGQEPPPAKSFARPTGLNTTFAMVTKETTRNLICQRGSCAKTPSEAVGCLGGFASESHSQRCPIHSVSPITETASCSARAAEMEIVVEFRVKARPGAKRERGRRRKVRIEPRSSRTYRDIEAAVGHARTEVRGRSNTPRHY